MSALLGDVKLFLVLIVVNVPVYVLIWRALFGDWDDFTEALYHWVSPWWLAWLRGESVENSWARVQLLAFGALSLAVVVGEFAALRKSAPGLARWLSSVV
jgi:hypothetical protein